MNYNVKLINRVYELLLLLPLFENKTPINQLPENGIYVFFEKGETVRLENAIENRVVRIGTHRKDNRFRNRIRQHYGNINSLGGNKNGSVFRKHLGGALLRKNNLQDPRLKDWLTQDGPTFAEIEELVSSNLRNNFTFSCFSVNDEKDRLTIERGLISLFAQYPIGGPSQNWLGLYAADEKVRKSCIWNSQHINSDPLNIEEFHLLEDFIKNTLEDMRY